MPIEGGGWDGRTALGILTPALLSHFLSGQGLQVGVYVEDKVNFIKKEFTWASPDIISRVDGLTLRVLVNKSAL